jgi:acyl-CoA reductase-like NAD-dependent aldehyde dehydrogenase
MDEATQLGAIVSQEQFDKVVGYIEIGRREGATVACGGEVPEVPGCENGWFVEPTLFTNATNEMRVAREEIFGPVLVAIPFEGEEEAVRIANDTPYGLGSGVFTTNADRAQRMVRAIHSGTVYVNTYNQVYPQSPFPGWKQSGTGVERGIHGLLENVRYKNVIMDISGEPIDWFD